MLYLGIDIGGTSVKAAAVRNGQTVWTHKSSGYARPSFDGLARAVAEAASRLNETPEAIGMCAPGLLDATRTTIVKSVNVPGLMGTPLRKLVTQFGVAAEPVIATDANATAYDIYASRNLAGRLLAIVIGTGVGAAVVDDGGKLLYVDGDSPGHLGQCDVSLDDDPPIGPDGGAGSLEGYLGVPALIAGYGSVEIALREMKVTDPPFRALARIIRIAHGIYRPLHVCLAGGIGIRMARLLPEMHALANQNLTRIAEPDWTLIAADHDYHAAVGAARLAARKSHHA